MKLKYFKPKKINNSNNFFVLFSIDFFYSNAVTGSGSDLGLYTVCPGSSDPVEKIFNIFAPEIEVYTSYQILRYFRLNIIRSQSKIILGHMNSTG